MFGRKFMNFGWCKDKYAIFDIGHCYDCGYKESNGNSLYCNYWKKNTSGSDKCKYWIPD